MSNVSLDSNFLGYHRVEIEELFQFMQNLSLLTPKEKIAFLDDKIQKFEFWQVFMGLGLLEYLKKMHAEQTELSKKGRSGENITPPPESFGELLSRLGIQMVPINGKRIEIGRKFGNFFANARNKNGDHLFDIDDVTLAKIVCCFFCQQGGQPFNLKTMTEYIADGRKMSLDDC